MLRKVTRLLGAGVIVAAAALSTTPVLAGEAPPSRVPEHFSVHPTRHHAPTPGDADFSGWDIQTVTGKNFVTVDSNFIVTPIRCADVVMGTSGTAYMDTWVGLQRADLMQDGIGAYCTGPSGHNGTAGPFYYAWYDILASGPNLKNFPNQPTLHAGDSVGFQTTLVTSGTHAGQYQFTYVDHTAGKTIQVYESCPSGKDCTTPNIAIVTAEAPGGGPPAYPLPWWTSGPAFTGSFVISDDGTRGSLNPVAGEWNNPFGPQAMDFTQDLSPGYTIPDGDSGPPNSGFGYPNKLSSDGASFDVPCVYNDLPIVAYLCT